MIRIALTRRLPDGPGACEVCRAPADMILRTTSACGAVVLGHACTAHEAEALAMLRSATLAPHITRRQVPALLRAADRLEQRASGALRRSADLRGASSLTHTYGLIGGALECEARALRALVADARERVANLRAQAQVTP